VIVGMVAHRRHAARYREIVRIMVAHGLGGLVAPLGRSRRRSAGAESMEDLATGTAEVRARHLRMALEELGPTFIKLGQILSTRVDLLPPVYIQELERLQDRIAPDVYLLVKAQIEEELRAPISSLFFAFETDPIAVASLGQVHGAVLHDGTRVVVKVQRSHVSESVNEDVSILQELARSGESRSALLRSMGIASLVDEFAWTIRGELDYLREARNAVRLRTALERDATIRIPKVHWDLTTSTVLTIERVDGIRIDDIERITAAGHDPIVIAQNTIRSLATQILVVGLFHADPHPGNSVVCEDGAVGMYDFGLVGSLDERLREHLLFLALAISERDAVRVVDQLATLGAVPGKWDRTAMERDIGHLMTKYVGVELSEIPLEAILNDGTMMIRRHGLRLPASLALLAKTATMAEALSRRLDPDINVIDVADPAIRAAIKRFYSPTFWKDRLKGRPLEVMLLSAALPGHIQRFFSRLDRNDFTMHIQVDDMPIAMHELNSMVNRLVLAIIAAALAIGTAMLVLAISPTWGTWQGYVIAGAFAIITVLVISVLFRVWRSSRK